MPRLPKGERRHRRNLAAVASRNGLDHVVTKHRIALEADPIGFLIKVMKGERIRVGFNNGGKVSAYVYPQMDDRIKAAAILTAKLLPDVRTVPEDQEANRPITIKITQYPGAPNGQHLEVPYKEIAPAQEPSDKLDD